MVKALAMVLTMIARTRIARGSLCTASIALSVPWPSASGANIATSSADTSAPPNATSGIAHGLEKWVPEPGLPPSPKGCGT
jgi:hypothetical protein